MSVCMLQGARRRKEEICMTISVYHSLSVAMKLLALIGKIPLIHKPLNLWLQISYSKAKIDGIVSLFIQNICEYANYKYC